jgi:LAO/AO transport system kinase
MKWTSTEMAARVLAGDRLALARLLTLIENEDPHGLEALSILYPQSGNAHIIGITGAPGTGKSTLVNRLARLLRDGSAEAPDGVRVAVVAVDPSSPFSGGAILGDRIRMRDLAGDPGLFIRSMASRGALGGLARTTAGVVEALDAAGYQCILIETVGAGQAEVEIARLAHTTVVVDAPGRGDDVQAIKAGILEIADILVVNKFDLPSAENTLMALKAAMSMANYEEGEEQPWQVPVLPAVATRGEGIDALAESIAAHRRYLERSGELQSRDRARVTARLQELLRERLERDFLDRLPDGRYEAMIEEVLARKRSPTEAVAELLQAFAA